ncbi:reverse transcriptase domain-containing protein [Tanacetum coccineum]
MVEGDEDKTTFFVGEGVFCYRKMPFGLKNAGATYQRLVDKVFSKQIRRNLEAYVDDMVIKSTFEEGMLSDIQENFERFRLINMKLNPKKCSFGVEEGPFLGYLITKQGIKANPTKIKAVIEKIPPFLQGTKKLLRQKKIHWTDEADKAFKEIKKFIQALPMLTAPRVGETLTMYLATSKEIINAALFAKRSAGKKASKILSSSYDNGSYRDERETPADFLPEIPFDDSEKKVKEKEVSDPSNEWKLYTDGASSDDGVGAVLMLIDPAGKEYIYALRFEFETTNNEAEYEALIAGLRIAQEMETTKVAIFLDSQLVVNQIKGTYATKQLSIKSYLQKVKTALKGFEGYTIEHYKLIRGNLHKRSIFTPWLRCIAPPQTDKIIKEIHEGSCGFNAEPRLMVVRITKQGYYWPSMHMEAAKAIQDYDKCKEQSATRKARADEAITVGSTWPFSHWGIHILGPLLMAPRVCRFGVPRMISLKEEKHFKEGTLADFCKGLKITQTFSPITEHMEIMHYIEKQPVRSQQGWVDNLAKELWVHRTLPRNSQEETPFSLTYGSEAVVPIVEATDDRGRTQETTKKCKEIASIEKAHYRNKLEKYHITRNNYSNYIVGDFVLFPTSLQEQQGPHMISEVHKDGFYTLVNIADHSLVQKAKGTSLSLGHIEVDKTPSYEY